MVSRSTTTKSTSPSGTPSSSVVWTGTESTGASDRWADGRLTVPNRCSMVKDRGLRVRPRGTILESGADIGLGYAAGRRKIFDRVQGL